MAEVAMELCQYDEAITCLSSIPTENTPNTVLFQLGLAFDAVGRSEEPVYRHNLGVALAHLGKLEQAQAELQKDLRLKPDYLDSFHHLSSVSAKLTLERHAEGR